MKQFLNVLYRRILYKIPLKFLLILLAVFAVFIATVKADSYVCSPYFVGGNDSQVSPGTLGMRASYDNVETTRFCFTAITDGVQYSLDNSNRTSLPKYNAVCFNKDEFGSYTSFYWKGDSSRETVYWSRFKGDCFSYTILECQTEYNLIPISSVDSNYCTTNNLCPSSECPVCPVGSGGVSSLYINDILHVGAPFIYMTIPQEIGWDYEYTQGGTNMLIDVEGYNVDYDKIEGIVNTQSYTPDEYDLNSIITNVIPLFVPGLVIILFIYFVFRLIKKIF